MNDVSIRSNSLDEKHMKIRQKMYLPKKKLKNPKPYQIMSMVHNLEINYLHDNITYKEFNRMYDILNELYDFYEELQIQEKKQN